MPLTGGCVLTIGNFDGVHLGHRMLIGKTAKLAAEMGLPALVLTFAAHPQSLLRKQSFKYILSAADKERLVAAAGADLYYSADFELYKDLSPEEFVRTVLIEKLGARHVVCGYNFSFGKGGRGNPALLKELLAGYGVDCTIAEAFTTKGGSVSSTRLRALISAGDMEAVATLLGRLYSFTLPVAHGRRLGSKLGSPTINQHFPEDRAMPAFGVYAVLCRIDGALYGGVANIGVKPTVGYTDAPLCETHIFDFNGDLYGKEVQVYLCRHLRGEKKFDNVDQLTRQIARDAAYAKEVLERGNYRKDGAFII